MSADENKTMPSHDQSICVELEKSTNMERQPTVSQSTLPNYQESQVIVDVPQQKNHAAKNDTYPAFENQSLRDADGIPQQNPTVTVAPSMNSRETKNLALLWCLGCVGCCCCIVIFIVLVNLIVFFCVIAKSRGVGSSEPIDLNERHVSANNLIANQLTSIQNSYDRAYLNIDRGRFNFYPGYIFNEYRTPLLVESVNFHRENGMDEAGITNDFLSQALEFYVREDEGIRLMGENGVIGVGKNQTKIRDLTRFSIMCLAKEDRNPNPHSIGFTRPTCPLTNQVFSPYNIWLSMVDEDQNTDEYDEWKQKTIGTEMLNGRSGFDEYPDRDVGVKPYYVEMGLAEEDDEGNYTVRDFINDQTSNVTSIVREVLEEYGMLTVVREAYRDGTLMQYLNELWKPEWNADSGKSIKRKVRELVRGSNRRSFRVFHRWVKRQSDDGDSLRNLWKHWSGVRVLTEDKLNRAVLVEQRSNDDNEASNFIRSHTCAVQLDIPSSLNENNIENVMRVSLQSSGYGSV